uniref:Uncharacterized protein n=1 Tax=Arundo donax TaxID=35708 RepID=A0A0A9DDY0_ARUDO
MGIGNGVAEWLVVGCRY